jgi:hypothetical protein
MLYETSFDDGEDIQEVVESVKVSAASWYDMRVEVEVIGFKPGRMVVWLHKIGDWENVKNTSKV